MSYRWFKAGTALIGGTSATLSLANVSSASARDYTVTVTNVAGAVASSVGH